jgi:glycosyltransferase involved in cell wall biosynthesis
VEEKKRILFVMSNLNCGGAEKSLISLLQTIDYNRFEVDLQLFENTGLFLKQVPSQVTVLQDFPYYKLYDMSLLKAIKIALYKVKIQTVWNRLMAGYIFKTKENSKKEQRVWKYLKRDLPATSKSYDVAIGFLEKSPIYYVVDKVNAKRKIGFVHNDYEQLGMDVIIDQLYFPKLDFIVTDSQECCNVLVRNFPDLKSKFRIIYNIISEKLINSLSNDSIIENFDNRFKVVSIGRFEKQKGYDIGIEAMRLLKEKGYDFQWIILGEGSQKQKIKLKVEEYNLKNHVYFLGIKENHYPYLKIADVFMQTSRFEGKSIAIDEAKILAKPILVTNFSTVNDQIEDGVTGSISEMNYQEVCNKLIQLIEQSELRRLLNKNLASGSFGTESEIGKIYQLLE